MCPTSRIESKRIKTNPGESIREQETQEAEGNGSTGNKACGAAAGMVRTDCGVPIKRKDGKSMPLDDMPPKIQKVKERIRRLTDDMEQLYKNASKSQNIQ